jgi:hypothetical protein
MNKVIVWQPRWHDRVILPRVDKFVGGDNIITIKHHNWPSLYYINSATASQYPQETKYSKAGDPYQVYVIPLKDLTTVQERQDILDNVRSL